MNRTDSTAGRYSLDDIRDEAASSRSFWGPYRSTHEAYGVICEEMHELLQAIQANDEDSIGHEAMQIAAVAYRLASEGWKRD